MALLHEHLYRSENLDKIHLAGYLRSLSSIVLSTISGHRVRLHLNLEECDSTIETALPIGLIVNELLTNSIKYAFPDQGEGDITLSLNKEENQMYALMVGDNGIGLPAGFNLDTEDSLGMFIVKLLVEQLDGTITINSQDGSTFIIRFPIVNQEHKKYK
jgi:two-component sensor histidine kinase